MAQTLEGIKGGGGSIKVGTTGTISSLMTGELDQISSAPHKLASSRNKLQTASVSLASGTTTSKRQLIKSSDEGRASSSGSSNSIHHRSTETAQKTTINGRHAHRIPMLGSDNISVDRRPIREKHEKKISNIVEVVDIKCGNPDKAWAIPITNRLKKLGFSKLSQGII